jgi:ABC-2 type transport system ATP-binding protein
VIGIAQIGADLRVLTDRRDDSGEAIAERVHATDPAAHIERVDSNLEDVFVASTRKPAASQEKAA